MSAVVVGIAIAAAPARCSADPLPPWEGLGDNLGGIYGWPNIMYTVSAFALTPPLVYTLDEPVQERVQKDDPINDPFGETANVVGGLMPLVLPLAIYGVGSAQLNDELTTAGSAALQALVVQFVVVSALKWLGDREGPFPDGDPAQAGAAGAYPDPGDPTHFNFNAFEFGRGLWPSGHTASNFALVSSLVAFYPDQLWLPVVGYPFALAVGLGMIEGDYHWLSDVVAGGLMGHVIGWVIGANFRKRFDAKQNGAETARLQAGLTVLPTPTGLRVVYRH